MRGKEPPMEKSDNARRDKIIIIDDNEEFLSLVYYILIPYSYEVVTCSSPVRALEMLDSSFDLVVLDLMMSEMSGEEVVSWIRSRKSFDNLPIIILTARDRDNDEIAGLFKAGINDFITKPFLNLELISRLDLQIRVKKMVEEMSGLNQKLKAELEQNKKTNLITLEYATFIENDLMEKLNNLSIRYNTGKVKNTITKLRARLAYIRDDKEKLIRENNHYREELDKLNKIHSVVVLHDSAIEDEMTLQIDEVNRIATHDQLTQTFNRIKFYESLYFEIENFRANKKCLSLIMFDIDHFKEINDTYGHDAGDSVLVALAETVKGVLFENAVLARWGGEEFMILVPGYSLEQAKAFAEIIRTEIEKLRVEDVGRVTCSFGVAQFTESDDPSIFLKRVDNALYSAKNNGRNRVECFSN